MKIENDRLWKGLLASLVGTLMAATYPTALLAQSAEATLKEEVIALSKDMEPFSVRVIGPPVNSQEWQFIDKNFWSDTINELSSGKLKVQHNSVTELNIPPGDVFQLTARGTFDVADVTANYGAGELVALDGIDLAGVATTMDDEIRVLSAYQPVLETQLKKRFRLDLLGLGVGGPQVFFCRHEVKDVEDLRGKKVRVSSSTLADFLNGLDLSIIPISMSLTEVLPALQRGVVDCVITGAMAGNVAKLHEVSKSLYTLIVGWSPKARVTNANYMSKLSEPQQAWLKKMTDYYYQHVNNRVQRANLDEGIWCTVADSRCTMGGNNNVTLANLTLAEPSASDIERARAAVRNSVLPAFGKACGKDCTDDWNQSVGEVVNMTIQ